MEKVTKFKINGGYPIHTYEDIRELFSAYISNQEDRDLIYKAYRYAEEKHKGVFRKTGEPYIQHPIEVCYILASLHVDPKALVAGFIHDVVEDTNTSLEEIKKEFGDEVEEIIDPLTKIQRLKLSHQDRLSLDAEDHRKIFLGMAKDIRVILIKLADRLHNMRTIESLSDERKLALSKETLEVFVPIAHRLGIYSIQSELEDLSLRNLEPQIYEDINNLLNKKMKYRKSSLDQLMKRVADILFEKNIPFEITSRVKSIYSIYKKIYKKGHSFNDIYDIMAIRIITDTELRCYEIIGIIHSVYKPIPGRFKDYIAVPKANMYQSLHTSIVSGDGNYFEVQVRTKEMDEVDETGVAAHWKYKEGTSINQKQQMKEIEDKLHWFRDFVAISGEQSESAKDYMENLKHEIFETNVYCLTPQGKVIDLPTGATPLDFAYKIHSKVGDTAVGAVVNNIMVPLNTVLKSGDVVEIKTNPNSPGPNEGWLKIAKSSSALSHIRKALLKKNAELVKEEKISKGKSSLIETFKSNGYSEEEMMKYIDDKKVFDNYSLKDLDELFIEVSNKTITPNALISFLKLKKNAVKLKFDKVKKMSSKSPVIIGDESEIAVQLGSCCSPIPGDDIVGYITKGKGVTIHRVNCPNIIKHKERLMDANWREDLEPTSYPVDIQIVANDRSNLLVDVMNVIAKHGISISTMHAESHPESLTAVLTGRIYVSDVKMLNDIFNVIQNIDSVFEVTRVFH